MAAQAEHIDRAVAEFRRRVGGLSWYIGEERRQIEVHILATLQTIPCVRRAEVKVPWYEDTIVVVTDPPHLRRGQLDRWVARALRPYVPRGDEPRFELVHADDAADRLLRGER